MNAFRPFDYGAAVNAGNENALGQLQVMAGAEKLRSIQDERKRNAYIMQLQGRAAGGDKSALSKMAAIDPGLGERMQSYLKTASDEQRASLKARSEDFGWAASNADTPQKWDATFSRLSSTHPEATQLVGRFSPELRDYTMAMGHLTSKAVDEFGPLGQVPGAPEGTLGQREKRSGEWTVKVTPKDNADSSAGLKDYQYQEIGRAIRRYFPEDALYDSFGNFTGLKAKAERTPKINAAITRAEQLLRDDPRMVVGEAVDKALADAGLIQIPGASQAATAPGGKPFTGYVEGQTATNPRTGERIQFTGGRWSALQ